jgi:hypothetical protein
VLVDLLEDEDWNTKITKGTKREDRKTRKAINRASSRVLGFAR